VSLRSVFRFKDNIKMGCKVWGLFDLESLAFRCVIDGLLHYGAVVVQTGRWEETNWCASGRHFMVGVRRHTPAVCGQATQQSNLFNDSVSTAQVKWRCRGKKIT
jgi:hypothetical protein